MNRFKISASADNASEIIDMLVFMGCGLLVEKEQLINEISRGCTKICESDVGVFTTRNEYNSLKEITLQELRDMVVLKRNDVGDANYTCDREKKYYVTGDGVYMYVVQGEWSLCKNLTLEKAIEFYGLNPIKGEVMKEYLVKTDNGNYLYTKNVSDIATERVVEIPEGAEIYTKHETDEEVFYKKGSDFLDYWDGKWLPTKYSTEGFVAEMKCLGSSVLWQRESLNDKIATAEVAQQEEKHSHYKKDVSHLNMIDPYRIADLYNLHPCADHIMKKSLCAGNRGHKDTLRDIQDIIDTAERWKQMIEEDDSEI